MELTKEYFEQYMERFVTKEEFNNELQLVKNELQKVKAELIQHAVELQEHLARMVGASMQDFQEQLDVWSGKTAERTRQRIDQINNWQAGSVREARQPSSPAADENHTKKLRKITR